mmetsp:Transcript_24970/g.54288  ORF Transcript_24970/g.54288 Transcript_24970/m.54288 type:complete len:208 (+) Transcript_24970:1035-1658(+)
MCSHHFTHSFQDPNREGDEAAPAAPGAEEEAAAEEHEHHANQSLSHHEAGCSQAEENDRGEEQRGPNDAGRGDHGHPNEGQRTDERGNERDRQRRESGSHELRGVEGARTRAQGGCFCCFLLFGDELVELLGGWSIEEERPSEDQTTDDQERRDAKGIAPGAGASWERLMLLHKRNYELDVPGFLLGLLWVDAMPVDKLGLSDRFEV